MSKGLSNLYKLCIACLVVLSAFYLTACGSMTIETDRDKMDQLILPAGWTMVIDTPHDMSKRLGRRVCGYADMKNKIIYTPEHYITAAHEVYCHAYGGPTHDNCPDRYMNKGC